MFYLNKVLLALAMVVVFLSGCSTVPEAQRNQLITKTWPLGPPVILPVITPKTFYISTTVGSAPGAYVGDDVVRKELAADLVSKGYLETSEDQATYDITIRMVELLNPLYPPPDWFMAKPVHSTTETGVVVGILGSTSSKVSGVAKGGVAGGLIGFAAGGVVSSIAHSMTYKTLSSTTCMNVGVKSGYDSTKKSYRVGINFSASENNIAIDEATKAEDVAIVKTFSGYF